jgi:hypothetical protein
MDWGSLFKKEQEAMERDWAADEKELEKAEKAKERAEKKEEKELEKNKKAKERAVRNGICTWCAKKKFNAMQRNTTHIATRATHRKCGGVAKPSHVPHISLPNLITTRYTTG